MNLPGPYSLQATTSMPVRYVRRSGSGQDNATARLRTQRFVVDPRKLASQAQLLAREANSPPFQIGTPQVHFDIPDDRHGQSGARELLLVVLPALRGNHHKSSHNLY